MKILHTSDLHIGKRLMLKSRLNEQKEVLNEINMLCRLNDVELVLIAGDVFDTYVPSAEAEEAFYEFINALANEERAVVIISGNHDDGVRLSACASLASKSNVYIVDNQTDGFKVDESFSTRPVECGRGYLIIQNKRGERVFINTLPYPNEARLGEYMDDAEGYTDKILRWIAVGNEYRPVNCPSILLSHIFVVGGEYCGSEREIDVGGTRAVAASALPYYDYVALGHLHRAQKIGGNNVYYSGSILQYSFDEAGFEKYVNVFDLTKDGVSRLDKIKLNCGKRLARLTCNGISEAYALLDKYQDHLVELTLRLSEPISQDVNKRLAEYTQLTSLILSRNYSETGEKKVLNSQLSGTELFKAYYDKLYSAEPSDELVSLFLALSEEESDEA